MTAAAAPVSATAEGRPLVGALWMLVSGLCFVGVNASVKVAGAGLPAAQSAFLRFVLGLVFILPVLRLVIAHWPRGRELGLFGLRGALHTGAVICWFYAMTRIPMAEVTAMGYLTPVFTALGAAVFLGERLRARRLAAIAAAIAGALIVLRPGVREIADGHLAMVGTTLCFALSYLVAKPLSGRYPAAVVVAMLSITVTIGLAPLAAAVWVPVSGAQVAGLFVTATCATAGHYAMTRAFAAAPITVTQPVTALQLVWSVAIGAAFFAEPVDMFVVAGGALIVGAVVFIALREASLARAAQRASPPPPPRPPEAPTP